MGILDLFSSKPATEATPAPAGTPATPTSEAPEPTGLDKFTDLATFVPDPEKAPKPFDPAELISADPEALQKQVSQMNFIQGALTKEEAQAIAEGGEGALNAMAKALNAVAQRSFMQATLAAKEVSAETLRKSLSHIDERINSNLRQDKINAALSEANPALSHPAAKMVMANLIPQIQAKFPEASPEEVKEKTLEYFTEFTKAFSPTKEEVKPTVPGEVENWFDWVQQ
jgi:hypothetical protein